MSVNEGKKTDTCVSFHRGSEIDSIYLTTTILDGCDSLIRCNRPMVNTKCLSKQDARQAVVSVYG